MKRYIFHFDRIRRSVLFPAALLLSLSLANTIYAEDLFKDNFSSPAAWTLSGFKDGKRISRISGQSVALSSRNPYHGHKSMALSYNFTTEGEDAVFITKKVSDIQITKESRIVLSVFGDKSYQRLFMVLKEKSGEKHFIDLGKIRWKGWKKVSSSVSPLFVLDKTSPAHWGGDENRQLEPPLTEITIGISDVFDKFNGKGVIYLGELRIVEQIR